MMRPLTLFGKNVAYTVASLTLWLVIGYLAGTAAASIREPGAARFVQGRAGGINTSSLDNFYAVRDGTMAFCAWCGLIVAQVVFVADQFAPPIVRENRPGGFPVEANS